MVICYLSRIFFFFTSTYVLYNQQGNEITKHNLKENESMTNDLN